MRQGKEKPNIELCRERIFKKDLVITLINRISRRQSSNCLSPPASRGISLGPHNISKAHIYAWLKFCLLLQVMCSCTVRPNKGEQDFGAARGLSQGQARGWGGSCPESLKLPKGLGRAFLKGRGRQELQGTRPACTVLQMAGDEAAAGVTGVKALQ